MLTKAVILVLIAASSPSQAPKAVQAGIYSSVEECRAAGNVFLAAAQAAGARVEGVCITTQFALPGKAA